jgi:hypothetical protein
MYYLFDRPMSGWRYEPQRPQDGAAGRREALQARVDLIAALPSTLDGKVAKRRQAFLQRASTALRTTASRGHKRPPQVLRRANPRSLPALEIKMRTALLTQAAARNIDVSKPCWVVKADLASRLTVPEHFIAQIAQRWNRLGLCSQGVNAGMHDTHRDQGWGGPWVSSWQDTRYEIKLNRLAEVSMGAK